MTPYNDIIIRPHHVFRHHPQIFLQNKQKNRIAELLTLSGKIVEK